jgi:hypothetical protein
VTHIDADFSCFHEWPPDQYVKLTQVDFVFNLRN